MYPVFKLGKDPCMNPKVACTEVIKVYLSSKLVFKVNLSWLIVDANDNFHDLHPILSNNEVVSYFSLPRAITGYWQKEEEFVMFFHLPQMRRSDSSQNIIEFSTLIILQSDKWQSQLLLSDVNDCVDAKTTTICGK